MNVLPVIFTICLRNWTFISLDEEHVRIKCVFKCLTTSERILFHDKLFS